MRRESYASEYRVPNPYRAKSYRLTGVTHSTGGLKKTARGERRVRRARRR
jgi:hypothetical protein